MVLLGDKIEVLCLRSNEMTAVVWGDMRKQLLSGEKYKTEIV